MAEHYCMHDVKSGGAFAFDAESADHPNRCNKIARFKLDNTGVWLCAEHYDLWMRPEGYQMGDGDKISFYHYEFGIDASE